MPDTKPILIYQWYCALRRQTCDLHNFERSHKFRAAAKFVKQCEEIGLDIPQMQALVSEIIKYAKERKMLNRGLYILTLNELFEVCYKRILERQDNFEQQMQLIELSVENLRKIKEPLHSSVASGGYSNLLCVVNSGRVVTTALAISKKCTDALYKIDDSERSMLPSNTELMKIRVKLLSNKENYRKLKRILGDDLADSGVPTSNGGCL